MGAQHSSRRLDGLGAVVPAAQELAAQPRPRAPRRLLAGVKLHYFNALFQVPAKFGLSVGPTWQAAVGCATNACFPAGSAYGGGETSTVDVDGASSFYLTTPTATAGFGPQNLCDLGSATSVITVAPTGVPFPGAHVATVLAHPSTAFADGGSPAYPAGRLDCLDLRTTHVSTTVSAGQCAAIVLYAAERTGSPRPDIMTYMRINGGAVVALSYVKGSGDYSVSLGSPYCGPSNVVEAITLTRDDAITHASEWAAAEPKSLHPMATLTVAVDTAPAIVLHGSDSDAAHPLALSCQGCATFRVASAGGGAAVDAAVVGGACAAALVAALGLLWLARRKRAKPKPAAASEVAAVA